MLDDWAEGLGAQRLCRDGPFRLWAWQGEEWRAQPVDNRDLCGIVVGDVYSPVPHEGAPAPSESTAVSLSAAYRRQGPSCLPHLSGQFSTILWDLARQELFLFRDQSSTRSIYYSELPGEALVFADALDLLVSGPLVEKRLSHQAIHEYLRFLDVSSPHTIFEGVFSTEPGVPMCAAKGNLRQESTAQSRRETPPHSLVDAANELEIRLEAAVGARLSSSGNTVTFLSGGVDSSLVCALAARLVRSHVEAVTVGFEQEGYDESSTARRIAAHLGVRHHVLSYPMTSYRDAFEELSASSDFPFADPAGVPSLLAFRTARELGDTALDGTGADTLFGVMPARHQRLAVEYGTLLPRPLRRLAAEGLKALPVLREYAPLVDFDDPEEILIRWRGWSRHELERLCGEPVSLEHTRFYRLFKRFPRGAHLQRYSILLGNLPDDRIHQASAITGLEVRFPYFEPRVTEWVNALDQDLRYHPSEPKRVLKAVLERHIPRRLWDFPKHGFDFPFVDLMAADDCALVREYLDPAVTGRWSLFDQQQLAASTADFLRGERPPAFGDRSPAFRVWALLVLFAWLENRFRHL
jgi:asparagine synthase (glutamine-hydrolysing)